MRRVLVGFCVGAVTGVLTLAGFGAWFGYVHGNELSAPGVRTPLRAAAYWADEFVADHWWIAGGIGGVMSGAAGLGVWLARDRHPDGREQRRRGRRP
jgi:hypothetical protein